MGKSVYQECGTLAGSVAALILYNRELSDTEMFDIEATLRTAAD